LIPQNKTNKKYITEKNEIKPKIYFLICADVLFFTVLTITTAVNNIVINKKAIIIISANDSLVINENNPQAFTKMG
jgi:hypothetical protein